MNEKTNHRKRLSFFQRRYLVDPSTQSKIMLFAVHVAGMTALATYCAIDLIRSEHFVIAGLITLTLLGFILVPALLLSHSIAGPVLRMKNLLARMIEGEKVEQIWLRENDSFKDLAALLNKLVENEQQDLEE